MGLSSLPAPSEGVLCIILVNTALSISMVKGIIRSILDVVGIHLSSSSSSSSSSASSSSSSPASSSSDSTESPSESLGFRFNHSDTFVEEFRSRTPTIRFDAVCRSSNCKLPEEHDFDECSVCLSEFEPDSEINYLSCGHLFHKLCLEKWLKYWNITCPLCRTPMLLEEESYFYW